MTNRYELTIYAVCNDYSEKVILRTEYRADSGYEWVYADVTLALVNEKANFASSTYSSIRRLGED